MNDEELNKQINELFNVIREKEKFLIGYTVYDRVFVVNTTLKKHEKIINELYTTYGWVGYKPLV